MRSLQCNPTGQLKKQECLESIIGHILFFTYINEIPNIVTSSIKLFTDNTTSIANKAMKMKYQCCSRTWTLKITKGGVGKLTLTPKNAMLRESATSRIKVNISTTCET